MFVWSPLGVSPVTPGGRFHLALAFPVAGVVPMLSGPSGKRETVDTSRKIGGDQRTPRVAVSPGYTETAAAERRRSR